MLSRRAAHVRLVEQVLDHVWLLLASEEMPTDGGHHLVPVRGRLFPSALFLHPDTAVRRGPVRGSSLGAESSGSRRRWPRQTLSPPFTDARDGRRAPRWHVAGRPADGSPFAVGRHQRQFGHHHCPTLGLRERRRCGAWGYQRQTLFHLVKPVRSAPSRARR